MAEKKIIWSRTAKKKLYAILESPIRRTNSKTFSIELYKSVAKELKLLQKYQEKGLQTSEKSIRGLFISNCLFLFEISGDTVIIHTVSDQSKG